MAGRVDKSFWIAAPRDEVFELYCDGTRAVAWLGMALVLEPFEGGAYRLDMGTAGTVTGEVLEFERPRFVHHTVSDGAGARGSHIRMAFEEEGGGTRLTLSHSGFDDDAGASLAARTWDHHLARLAVTATGGAPGEDPLAQGLFSSGNGQSA